MRDSGMQCKPLAKGKAVRPSTGNPVTRAQLQLGNERVDSTPNTPSKHNAAVASNVFVSVLTGGADRPYAFGLGSSLMSKVAGLDLIVCDELDGPPFQGHPHVNLLNLRGRVDPNVSTLQKLSRVLAYYARLLLYALKAKPKVFHILWNNKFEWFDRTILMVYYKLLGKKLVLTIHNVNKNQRDASDTRLNRLTLRAQYHLADHFFVHTEMMKDDLIRDFGVQPTRITSIPFGINNSVPNTDLSVDEARTRLGLAKGAKVLLFFGHITPYKGLEFLISAFHQLADRDPDYFLVIAGRPKNCEGYWAKIRQSIETDVQVGRIVLQANFVPDEETEIYFKAADVLVLPYRHIYQSGVLFLGQSFGLPALVADVGSLKNDVVEGETGFVFKPEDPDDLARGIEIYFASDLYQRLPEKRKAIRRHAETHHSWDVIGQTTVAVYDRLLKSAPPQLTKARTASQSKSTVESTSSQPDVPLQRNSSVGRL